MTVTAWHIHTGAVGVPGPVEIDLGGPISSGFTSSKILTAAQEANLTAHNFYVNLHSAIFPGGEIRGQLLRQ